MVGIEPGNVPCLNRSELRESGELPMMAAGEIKEIHLEIHVLEGNEEIGKFVDQIERTRVL